MSTTDPRLELDKVLRVDVADLWAAREKARILHHTRDIRASGNEVEQTVRTLIRRRLPAAYYVGHGHIVDSKWNCTKQFDVVLSDNQNLPVLFQAEDGTEYFAFESVYAIGEVKTTYKSGVIQEFVEKLADLKARLSREETPRNFLSGGITLEGGLTVKDQRPFKNPLFRFMVVLDSAGFSLDDIAELYTEGDLSTLPSIVCLLDYGVIVRARVETGTNSFESYSSIPEFATEAEGCRNRWVTLAWREDEDMMGANLAFLYSLLVNHLGKTVLKTPDMQSYFLGTFTNARGQAFT